MKIIGCAWLLLHAKSNIHAREEKQTPKSTYIIRYMHNHTNNINFYPKVASVEGEGGLDQVGSNTNQVKN